MIESGKWKQAHSVRWPTLYNSDLNFIQAAKSSQWRSMGSSVICNLFCWLEMRQAGVFCTVWRDLTEHERWPLCWVGDCDPSSTLICHNCESPVSRSSFILSCHSHCSMDSLQFTVPKVRPGFRKGDPTPSLLLMLGARYYLKMNFQISHRTFLHVFGLLEESGI